MRLNRSNQRLKPVLFGKLVRQGFGACTPIKGRDLNSEAQPWGRDLNWRRSRSGRCCRGGLLGMLVVHDGLRLSCGRMLASGEWQKEEEGQAQC
jgi:hypothetical protein